MRGKTAKAIRKIARGLCVAAEQRGEDVKQDGYGEVPGRRKQVKNDKGEVFDISLGTLVNNPKSFRGIYRNLKKNLKRARRA